jgi:sortase A
VKRKFLMITGLCISLLGGVSFAQGAYIQVKAMLAQYLLQSAWEETLQGQAKVKPWSWADTWPLARLSVAQHASDLIVLEGATGRTLAFAPGHLQGTSAPGDKGFAVISAHRDTHFSFLQYLKVGDSMQLQTRYGEKLEYQVTATQIVDTKDAQIPDDTAVKGLMLVTCYPFDSLRAGGPLRYIVYAEVPDKILQTIDEKDV